ncbi:hypothetical protein [Agriterribacter sp.]|uniref:hypothetical protein n=1 Tax=Agriterribacter sp. TaxID=2821509 RepID=UPI002CA06D1B|nr:hypothetical protein [Agriterribacter sp.]HTN05778.1 hypothetical protein [Agriterribacter sp.]
MTYKKFLPILEVTIIVGLAIFPIMLTMPYRAYVYLSWEGAYRLSEGQLPFRDFGLPVGGMYWVVPAIFFKIFGAQVITLLKVQAFLNILSGLAFRSILKTVGVNPIVSVTSVLLYCISYSFQNFWPWYNHSVFVYGFIAVAFVLKAILKDDWKRGWVLLLLGAVFTFFSFFTKQDGGGLIFVICAFLLVYNSYVEKRWRPLAIYTGGVFLFIAIAVLFFSQYDFNYWFNHGQKPHNARISAGEIIKGFLGESQWLKFYLFIIVLLAISKFTNWKNFVRDRRYIIFLLLTLGILCMAAIIQITSYTPAFGNMFFHSFAFAFILNELVTRLNLKANVKILLPVLLGGVLLWWSQLPWEYLERMFFKGESRGSIVSSDDNENVVTMYNFKLSEENATGEQRKWVSSDLHVLKGMSMPASSIGGIERILKMDVVRRKKDIKVLNMSELTFLAAEIPYSLERNPKAPLWHHLGVGMFNAQLRMYEDRIRNNYYDLVIFEYVPTYNNLFPFAVRDALKADYQLSDTFDAPRSGSRPGTIEVYVKKQ